MAVDTSTVRRIAHLARIKVSDEEAERMHDELNAILGFVEQLSEVNTDGVEPLTSVVSQQLKMRDDVVNDGNIRDKVTLNAPASEEGYYMVPKVIE